MHEEGFDEGLEQGVAQGAYEKALETAKAMLKIGIPLEQVQFCTNLPLWLYSQKVVSSAVSLPTFWERLCVHPIPNTGRLGVRWGDEMQNSLWKLDEFVLEMGANLLWKLPAFVLEIGVISSTKF